MEDETVVDIRGRMMEVARRPMRIVPADAPELGEVFLRELSSELSDAWEDAWAQYRREQGYGDNQAAGFKASLIVFSLCDDQGRPLLTMADMGLVMSLPNRVIRRLYERAGHLSGILGGAEVEKNCDAAPAA